MAIAGTVERLPLIEPVAITDVFSIGVEPLEDFAEYVRLTFWADHPGARVVVARIVMPLRAYQHMIADLVGTPTMVN